MLLLERARDHNAVVDEPELLDYMQLRNHEALLEWKRRLEQHESTRPTNRGWKRLSLVASNRC